MTDTVDPTLFPGVRNLTACHSVEEALALLRQIYAQNTLVIQEALKKSLEEEFPCLLGLSKATYPFLGMQITPDHLHVDASLAYGVALEAGVYGATLTHPTLFEEYYREQLSLLFKHHKVPFFVGESDVPIPLPFALEHESISAGPEQLWLIQQRFVLPNLSNIDDNIANSYGVMPALRPLSLFAAERVDISLHRLYHYTGTSSQHFQRFILLTNYQRYVEEFIQFGLMQLQQGEDYEMLVEPGDVITKKDNTGQLIKLGERLKHLPQMPAYHLTRPDGNGITFINIGVGPSNAKTITDHLAVLRPHCWLMLGHCAGLRRSQSLGDYVLAHAYVRAEHVLDDDLPLSVPIPPIAEVQVALQQAVGAITGQVGNELKTSMRTGTVYTTDNRNWELRSQDLFEKFQQSRAIAVDMESATIAANGFRFRVPYGTLLCVSDKPVHGEIKLRGMANAFYRERVHQHLKIGLETMKILREQGVSVLHSRKLRGFDDPPFR